MMRHLKASALLLAVIAAIGGWFWALWLTPYALAVPAVPPVLWLLAGGYRLALQIVDGT